MRVTKYRPVCDCTLPRLEKWADRWMRDTHFRHAVRGLLYGDTWSKEQMDWLMSLWHKRHSLSKPIKEYDRIVDGRPDARKQLEQTNPGLVAARDQAVVEEKRRRIQRELAARSARQSNSRHR
jgi:hypothetical protein